MDSYRKNARSAGILLLMGWSGALAEAAGREGGSSAATGGAAAAS